MELLTSALKAAGVTVPETSVGLSRAEIDSIRRDQGVARMPARYVEFLQLMGRGAGSIMAGTDAFYPGVIGVKSDAIRLVVENNVFNLIPEGALVFAMHQGYQVYWFADLASDDPRVAMYQEGDSGVTRIWESFTAFLIYEMLR